MSSIAAVINLRWFALAGLAVTTTATAPIFLRGSDVTQEQVLSEAFIGDLEVIGDARPVAFASNPSAEELLSLLADAAESASLDPLANTRLIDVGSFSFEYMASTRNEDQDRGSSGGGTTVESFANGSQFASDNTGLAVNSPASSRNAMPSIGAHSSATPTIAIAGGSGGKPVAIETTPPTVTAPSLRPDRRIATSPRAERPNAVVAGVSRDVAIVPAQAHQASSPQSTPTGKPDETSSLQLLTDELPDSVRPSRASIDGESLTSGTDTALAVESDESLRMGSGVLEQLIDDAGNENAGEHNVMLATAFRAAFDVPAASLSSDAPTASPLAVPEPGSLALVGLGLGLAGLAFARRKQ